MDANLGQAVHGTDVTKGKPWVRSRNHVKESESEDWETSKSNSNEKQVSGPNYGSEETAVSSEQPTIELRRSTRTNTKDDQYIYKEYVQYVYDSNTM